MLSATSSVEVIIHRRSSNVVPGAPGPSVHMREAVDTAGLQRSTQNIHTRGSILSSPPVALRQAHTHGELAAGVKQDEAGAGLTEIARGRHVSTPNTTFCLAGGLHARFRAHGVPSGQAGTYPLVGGLWPMMRPGAVSGATRAL
eukprot:1139426-Prymnesium_polylepis.1